MKPGTTIIEERRNKTFPPTVIVGNDDRAVWVSFGTINIYLGAQGDGSTIVVRGETSNVYGERLPLEMRGATDVKNTVEFSIERNP